MSIGLYIALAPLSLNYAGKLQEKRFDFIKTLANIISENLVEVSKIKYFKPNQQTLNSLASLEGIEEQRQTLKKLSVQYTEQYRGTSPEPCIFSDISDVERLYYLETFEILGNITDIDLSPLSGNKNLQEIIVDLYYNTEVITVNGVFEKTYGLRRDIDITGLSDLPSLKKLHLSAHNITGANQIAKLNTIEDLYYRGNWDDLPDYYDFYKVIDSLPNLKTFGDGTNDLASMQAMINSYRNQGYLD